MRLDFWRSVDGMVEAELTSAEPETAFDAIGRGNIEIRNVQKLSELTHSFLVSRRNVQLLAELCKKRGETLRVQRKKGLYWGIRQILARRFLLFGGMMLLTIVLWMPSRVFFICVEGNDTIPDRKIIEAAETCGIMFGASRRAVRNEKVKNALLSAVPELQWAGVNTSGCTATISVRERSEPEDTGKENMVASIDASRDGYILSCTVTKGNLLVKPGSSVKEGQTLISAYTDCGRTIRAEQAEGEVFAQTSRAVEAVMQANYLQKGKQTEIKRKISLLLRKKRIFLWKDSGIWDASCGRMYEEYYVTLPGGFRLPFALCVEEYVCCETSETVIPEAEAEARLTVFSERYVTENMVAGKIIHAQQTVQLEGGSYRMKTNYACVEMIGRVRQEQIGDTNGENS